MTDTPEYHKFASPRLAQAHSLLKKEIRHYSAAALGPCVFEAMDAIVRADKLHPCRDLFQETPDD